MFKDIYKNSLYQEKIDEQFLTILKQTKVKPIIHSEIHSGLQYNVWSDQQRQTKLKKRILLFKDYFLCFVLPV